MSEDRNLHFREQMYAEIWEEIASLKGKELDDYLVSLGLSPGDLLQDHAKALAKAHASLGRARFEEARRQVRQRAGSTTVKILSFDLARKNEIMAAVKRYAQNSKNMTVAARNQKIEDERDLDSFLEACLRLGVIDDEGNLKE
jgi:hypothetical protein